MNANNEIKELSPEIAICYGVRLAERGGFLPVYSNNSRKHWDWRLDGFDEDTALAMAKAQAEGEAAHYVGDWIVTVAKERAGK